MATERLTAVAYFLLRVVSGLLLLQAGGSKHFGWPSPSPGGPPPMMSQIWIGGWIEIVCGLLVMIGLLTRPAAFLLSGTMAVAYWQFHYKPEAFWPTQNQGVPAAILAFVFLYIAARGGGEWSFDALFARNSDRPSA